jgi:hypothetical protein
MIAGIDPGNKGALVFVWQENGAFQMRGELLFFNRHNPQQMHNWIVNEIFEKKPQFCFSEMPFALMGQGHTLNYGRHFGHIEAAFWHLPDYPLNLVSPTDWQRAMLPNFGSGKSKEIAKAVFERYFPSIKTNDGVRDAALIALYGGWLKRIWELPALKVA